MRKLFTVAILLGALVVPFAQAVRLPKQGLPPGWSHAEVNVVIRRVPHTLSYDRGRVVSTTSSSVTIRERDGSLWTIPVASTTVIRIAGRPATIDQVKRLEQATTVRIDGGPAATLTVQIPAGLAKAIARQGAAGTSG